MAGWPTTWGSIVSTAEQFFRRHWQRLLLIRDRLRISEEAFHLLLAAAVGVIGGLTNWVYWGCNKLLQWIALGGTGDILAIFRALPEWQRLLIPALGGLVAGFVLFWGLKLIGNPGLSNLLEVVVAGDGRLPIRTALVSAASSLISISSGASIGREGLIIQLTSTVASRAGQIPKWPPYRLRLLVACGAAAGISAGCNAPIAGAVFAAQIVLGNFSMNLFAPLVIASVIASIISRSFFGINQWYEVPRFDFTRLTQLPWFLLLGVLSGVLGAGFLKALRVGERLYAKVPVPIYFRLGLGGLIVGAISIVYPEVCGNGYSATNVILHHDILPAEIPKTLWFVLGLLVAKFVATASTVGSGTVGGVFTPTLFMGAALGSLFGTLLHLPEIGTSLPTGAFAIVGMGSMLAATTHSPLLAMIMVFELSLNYSIMPPLMLACAISTLVARSFHTESIYTEPLRRKGVELERENPHVGAATEMTVADLMLQPVTPLRENTTFEQIAERFLTCSNNFLPVVDAKQRLLGIVALHDLKEYLTAGEELKSVIAYDIMRPVPLCLTPTQKLPAALPTLLASEMRNVPVVNNQQEFRLIGAVTRADALGLLSEAISSRTAPTKSSG
jgi:chloride channel protein, CIC family